MLERDNKLPIGLLLQNAGLISEEQLESALKLQSQYSKMKLGEIFVLQEGIRVKTIDFFVDRWGELTAQGQQFPIGYYLKKAFLLDKEQIKSILQEQKDCHQKFGEIAVSKGWVKQDTIDFFLSNLSLKPPLVVPLSFLEEYNRENLHLEKKYANHSLILSRILAWTGGNMVLTKTIAHVFARANFNIPKGAEIKAVDQFVETSLIRKWQTSEPAAYIRAVKHNLVKNPRCDPKLLLEEYREILRSEDRKYQNTPEQNELLLLGLVVPIRDRLRIANLIYQQVFNHDFITQEVDKYQAMTTTSTAITNIELPKKASVAAEYTFNTFSPLSSKFASNVASDVVPQENNSEIKTSPQIVKVDSSEPNVNRLNAPEPLTKIVSLITLAAIALLVPLFLKINNYYSSLAKQDPQTQFNSPEEADELQEFCSKLNFVDSDSSLELISQLELNKQELSQNFPHNCEATLNHLRVKAAPILGKENRILEAIRHLCKVPPESDMYVDAEIWLKRWYDSPNWGEETKFYLEESNKYSGKNCPAAHFTEYEN